MDYPFYLVGRIVAGPLNPSRFAREFDARVHEAQTYAYMMKGAS